jgi:hypothetical protein
VSRTTPKEWKPVVAAASAQVLPLVPKIDQNYPAGWCVYNSTIVDSPEVEIICGGINHKITEAAAVWRQGNLLHFGFEQAPDAMNETGKALLLNAIAYIARFTEDRPIPDTLSPFAGRSPLTRMSVDYRLHRQDRWPAMWRGYFAPAALAKAGLSDADACGRWYKTVRGFLCADDTGKLVIDEDALAMGAALDGADFMPKVIAGLRAGGEPSARARRLIERHVAEGPGKGASAGAWESWWSSNQPYLFFCDSGGYRWYIDPLAKKRGVQTSSLRGLARATPSQARAAAAP